MIHSNRFFQLTRKWQRVKAETGDADICCTTSSIADKGHCAVYTADGKRFEVPLAYIGTMVFSELLTISQEEFGFTEDGRITLPCDAAVLEYMLCLLRRNASEEVEKAFPSSVVIRCQHSSNTVASVVLHQQFTVCSS